MLRQEINEALKTAMKAQDRRATSTLRLILAALKDRDIAARGGSGDDSGIPDDAILDMLQKMIKQRMPTHAPPRSGMSNARHDAATNNNADPNAIIIWDTIAPSPTWVHM